MIVIPIYFGMYVSNRNVGMASYGILQIPTTSRLATLLADHECVRALSHLRLRESKKGCTQTGHLGWRQYPKSLSVTTKITWQLVPRISMGCSSNSLGSFS